MKTAGKKAKKPAGKATSQKGNRFEQRLKRYYDELRGLYLGLYQNDTQAFDYFLQMLRQCWKQRKRALQLQDAKREENPNWYRSRELLGICRQCAGGNREA